jgi:dTDP-4-amino-4,6-dideoxygalactose transaminase
MKKLISLEIGPNYQKDDAIVAFKSLFFASNKYQQLTSDWFKNRFDTPNIWFFNTCRAGIYSILKSFELPAKSEVLVQGFSCIVVPNAVLQAGLKTVICDVNLDNFNFDLDQIEAKITPNTKVWILQYNFGIIPDMFRVKQICEKYNLILIEDCAHALGGKFSIDGKEYQVGSFGHAAAFSFGRDKIISTTTGGAIIFNKTPAINTNFDTTKSIQKFESDYTKLQEMDLQATTQNLLYTILTAGIVKPFYYYGLGRIIAKISTGLKLTGQVYDKSEKQIQTQNFPEPQKYSTRLQPLLWNQIQKLNNYLSHRQQLARFYTESFGQKYIDGSVYMRFPIYLENLTHTTNINTNTKLYDTILTNSRKQGFFLGRWYNKVFLGASVDDQSSYNYDLENLKNIKVLIKDQVLNLPTSVDTNLENAKNIVNIIQKSLL